MAKKASRSVSKPKKAPSTPAARSSSRTVPKKAAPAKAPAKTKAVKNKVIKKVTKAKPAKKPAREPQPAPPKRSARTPPSRSTPKAKVTTAKAPKAPKKPAQPKVPAGYTAAQFQKYVAERKRLYDLGNAELKAILKKNFQSMSGNKDELVEKIADGITLGRIPRCPSCFGGRPRFDIKTGHYTCPGYRDDEDYKNCHKVFTKQELKRDPWEA